MAVAMTAAEAVAGFGAVRQWGRVALDARREAMGARNHDEEISARRREIAACDRLVDALAALEAGGVLARLAGVLEDAG